MFPTLYWCTLICTHALVIDQISVWLQVIRDTQQQLGQNTLYCSAVNAQDSQGEWEQELVILCQSEDAEALPFIRMTKLMNCSLSKVCWYLTVLFSASSAGCNIVILILWWGSLNLKATHKVIQYIVNVLNWNSLLQMCNNYKYI